MSGMLPTSKTSSAFPRDLPTCNHVTPSSFARAMIFSMSSVDTLDTSLYGSFVCFLSTAARCAAPDAECAAPRVGANAFNGPPESCWREFV
jgi:hypothetical protein